MPDRFRKYSALSRELAKAVADKNYAKVIDLCQQQVALAEGSGFDHGRANLNLACALAHVGRKDDALKALNLAVDQGFSDADRLKNSKNLESLRGDERFAAVVKRISLESGEATSKPVQPTEKQHVAFGVRLDDKAVIVSVMPDSGAAKAGLQTGDTIVRVNDQRVTQREEIAAMLANKAAGDKVRVTSIRDGKEHTAQVTLGRPSVD